MVLIEADTTGWAASGRNGGFCSASLTHGIGNGLARFPGEIGNFFVPVYDYVLVTQPLSAAQLASLGWRNRQGAADAGNQFHYFRLTADDRDAGRRNLWLRALDRLGLGFDS